MPVLECVFRAHCEKRPLTAVSRSPVVTLPIARPDETPGTFYTWTDRSHTTLEHRREGQEGCNVQIGDLVPQFFQGLRNLLDGDGQFGRVLSLPDAGEYLGHGDNGIGVQAVVLDEFRDLLCQLGKFFDLRLSVCHVDQLLRIGRLFRFAARSQAA